MKIRLCILVSLVLIGCVSATKPPVTPVPVQQKIIGRWPLPGEKVQYGRTSVWGGDLLIGYLIYNPTLFSEPRSPGDSGVSAIMQRDAGGTRFVYCVGDLQWCLRQAFGETPWTVTPP